MGHRRANPNGGKGQMRSWSWLGRIKQAPVRMEERAREGTGVWR